MANKEDFKQTLSKVRADSQKRNFKQAIDLVINVKDINLKKPEEHVEIFVSVPFPRGRKLRVCAFVGPELAETAKSAIDTVIKHDEFAKYTDKSKIKKLAKDHDFFISQANIMADVAKVFGRVLGPHGKMPNPKAGCVVPPNANLSALKEKLQKLVKVSIKSQLSFKCRIGTEEMKDEELLDNIMGIYTALTHALPQEENNIKNVLIKFTMGKPVQVGKAK